MENLKVYRLNRIFFKISHCYGNSNSVDQLVVLILLLSSLLFWGSCNDGGQNPALPKTEPKTIPVCDEIIIETQNYDKYYSDSTNFKIRQMMEQKKVLFSEAESLVLAEENVVLQKNGHFKILTESVQIQREQYIQQIPHKESLSIERIQDEGGFLRIYIEIVDASDIIWVGDVIRNSHSLSVRFDGLNGYAHTEELVRYQCQFEIEKLGFDYSSIVLNDACILPLH